MGWAAKNCILRWFVSNEGVTLMLPEGEALELPFLAFLVNCYRIKPGPGLIFPKAPLSDRLFCISGFEALFTFAANGLNLVQV